MRSKAIEESTLSVLLKAMQKENRLALEVSLCTGLRISDVLSLKTRYLHQSSFVVYEQKTGKRKKITLPSRLKNELFEISGHVFVFPGRLNGNKPRTRQAVWKDLHRVAGLFRLKGGCSPHSMRKTYAVDLRKMGLTPARIQKALNHTDLCVTALYMYADELQIRQ